MEEFSRKLNNFTNNKYYLWVILLIIMPINVNFIIQGRVILGVILILLQIPYLWGIYKNGFVIK